MANNDILIKLVADVSSLEKEMGKVKTSMSNVEKSTASATGKMKSAFLKVGAAVGTALATVKLVDFGKECLSLGAELEEMENKFDVVFGKTGKQVDKWAEEFAEAIGRSKTEIKTGVSNLGDLLTGYGMTEKAAGDLSQKVIELSYDLA